MQRLLLLIVATLLAFGANTPTRSAGPDSNLLFQVGTIPLDGVEGRIDHFRLDSTRKRLFVAALGNDTVEVVHLRAGRVTQQNLRAPQGIGFAPVLDRLAVANDEDGSCRFYNGTSLRQVAVID